ncbi:protein Wnt-16-like [Daphnia pulex]|uniref:protein Wnt-16-like n=1 Tax=Daphnia pulex TaxID=6669 RepID=UPI001EE00BC0|nr:protein Wnt-16-like [Daphnia pulex]
MSFVSSDRMAASPRRTPLLAASLLLFLLLRPVTSNWMHLGLSGTSPSLTLPPQPPKAPQPPSLTLSDQATAGLAAGGPDLHQMDQHNQQSNQMVTQGSARAICAALPGLVSRQIQVCQAHPNTIQSVSDGARKGIEQCQHQFRNERWNCTTKDDQNVFGATLERGSRETAFIYAVTSAGVVHAVTQACSLGNLTECSCDMDRQGLPAPDGWKWGGCSDNIRYGIQFARQFVDAPEKAMQKKPKNVRNLMNLHNNEAGRKAIATLMRMQCRCHGVSGSCELKTCWRTMPTFAQVGDYLKQKYENAVQMKPTKFVRTMMQEKMSSKELKIQSSSSSSSSKTKRQAPLGKTDLIHIHKSPNYCVEDPKKGILGTSGRVCNKNSTGSDSCDLLCCGRGYNTQVVRHVERCFCRFVWCCQVKCKTCVTMLDVHTCK